GQDDLRDLSYTEHSDRPLEARASARFHKRRMSCWTSLESSLASPSTRYRSNIGCVFWTAVRATSSCATIVSLSTHSGLSALGCFDYDVGVPTLYKGFSFSCPLVGWSGHRLPRLERLESP